MVTWKTKDGTTILIKDMSSVHLQHARALVYRKLLSTISSDCNVTGYDIDDAFLEYASFEFQKNAAIEKYESLLVILERELRRRVS